MSDPEQTPVEDRDDAEPESTPSTSTKLDYSWAGTRRSVGHLTGLAGRRVPGNSTT
jgi:hypothetical protein